MKDIFAIKNAEGKPCIKIMNNIDVVEMHELCEVIQKGLTDKTYKIGEVSIDFNMYFATLCIPVTEEETNETLYLKYISEGQPDQEYFTLVPSCLDLPDDYIEELWDEYYNKMCNDVFEILNN